VTLALVASGTDLTPAPRRLFDLLGDALETAFGGAL
jgi:hypothetical protein